MSSQTLFLNQKLYKYLCDHSLSEPQILRRLRFRTEKLAHVSKMLTSPEQVQFMALLAQIIQARRYLEIGTFTGYSALWMALSMPDSAVITACDTSKEWTDIAQEFWRDSGVGHKIQLRLAPAIETLTDLIERSAVYDIAYIDADKKNYLHYYGACLKLIRPGGIIFIDNIFQGGSITEKDSQDENVTTLQKLNQNLIDDDRVYMSMLPIGDGLTIVMKKRESL